MTEEAQQSTEEKKKRLAVQEAVVDRQEGVTASSQPAAKKKKKSRRVVTKGNAYIKATYNNTVVTFTDPQGNVLAWSSAGTLGFKGPKKSTPYVAGLIVKDATEKVRASQLKEIDVFVRGVGSGREAAIRAMNGEGFQINAIKDTTPVPFNGCRPRKVRRV